MPLGIRDGEKRLHSRRNIAKLTVFRACQRATGLCAFALTLLLPTRLRCSAAHWPARNRSRFHRLELRRVRMRRVERVKGVTPRHQPQSRPSRAIAERTADQLAL